MFQEIKRLFTYRTLIQTLVIKELKTRYRGSVLGFLWSLLNPLLLMLVYTVVFSIFMRVNMENYSLFMLSALLSWIWLSSSLLEGVNSIVSGGPLLKKAIFPPDVLPVVKVVSNLINYLLSIPILIILLYIVRIKTGVSLLFLPVLLILQGLFILGLTFLSAALNVLFRDVQYILNNILTIWFFLTPIAYPISQVPAGFAWLLYFNPMTLFAMGYQDIFFYRRHPSLIGIGILLSVVCITFWSGYTVFNRLKQIFIEEL